MAAPEVPTAGALDHGPDLVARMLDQKELQRLAQAVGTAKRLLGREKGEPDLGPEAIPALIAALEARLDGPPGALEAERAAHELQLDQLRSRFRRRHEAFGRVEAAGDRLREITSPPAILEAAPERLCESSELERVLLSTVRDGSMVATAAHFESDPDGAAAALAALVDHPIRLEHPLLEAEVLRRRRATGVTEAQLNPRVDPRLGEAMAWGAYVVAPVVVHGKVIGVLHADRGAGHLDVLDREVLWRFAVCLAQAYESAALRRGLRREREQMGRFLDRLNVRLGELSDSAIELAPPTGAVGPDPAVRPPSPPEDGSAFEGLLTRREVEVLILMAEGLSNRSIADRLVVSEGTIKFHVNSILKKLRAANRAEAVSRYLTRTRP